MATTPTHRKADAESGQEVPGVPAGTYLAHIRSAAETASRDFDGLVAKLGTAGLTLAGAATLYLEGNTDVLAVTAGAFAASTLSSLIAGRLSADALRHLAEDLDGVLDAQAAYQSQAGRLNWVAALNWVALGSIALGFVLAAILVATASPRSI